jgi:DUF4097 and DUF4098 domain-containing protein YvlB
MLQHVFETPGTVRLKISIGLGDIQIQTADRVSTEVELHALNGAAEEAIHQLTVRCHENVGVWEVVVEEEKRGFVASLFNNAEIGVRVGCPRDTHVELQTGSADARVDGDVASGQVKTGSGDMNFGTVAGPLTVNSASGDVQVGDVLGDCGVKTASGDVRISSVGGELTANLVSGDLNVGEARGSVAVQTVSGDQHIGAVSSGEIKLQAVSGDVHVGVRPGLRLWIDATSVSGEMSSELDSAEGPPAGGPLVQLRAKTVSGDVAIVRAA